MTIWTIARNDLKQTFREKMFLVWMLFFPMLFIVIFGLAFQSDPPEERKVSLNVLDLDHSEIQQMTTQLCEGEVEKLPVLLQDEVECDKVYIVAGYKGYSADRCQEGTARPITTSIA